MMTNGRSDSGIESHLTPFGFQSEERNYWEAPEVYYNMSPFMHCDKMKTPLLLIHGEADSPIPAAHSRQIAANTNPDSTELWLIPRADHGQAHAIEGPRYEERILTFFSRHL